MTYLENLVWDRTAIMKANHVGISKVDGATCNPQGFLH